LARFFVHLCLASAQCTGQPLDLDRLAVSKETDAGPSEAPVFIRKRRESALELLKQVRDRRL
jgi:hypothetical protein